MPPKAELKVGIFFVLPFQKGSAKKMPPQKTQEIPGFFACLGGKKVKGFSVDAKPCFSNDVGLEPATRTFLVLKSADLRI